MKNFFLFILSVGVLSINAQSSWKKTDESTIELTGKRQIIPQKYQVWSLNGTTLKDLLFSAPNEKDVKLKESNLVIELPLPNGIIQKFRVVEAPVMENGLGNAYPHIKTFSLKGMDDSYANGKADWNDFGFHAMIRTPKGDFFIDPYCVGNLTDYIVYYTKDFVKDPSQVLPEAGLEGEETVKKNLSGNPESMPPAVCVGNNLRTYRLAVACTGEYAVAATGVASPTKSQVLSKVVTSVNRVDGVYETEVAVRLVLVANDTLILFTNASTDPFTGNNNASTLINESQTVCNANIGSANYDIGHTFSTGGGGLAMLGCVCGSSKARGITGSPNPVGDPYDIDYVAHEMGHQFGGNHTFNAGSGSCSGNRNAATSVEPGSGITIMAYAGICGTNDLAPHSIAYFHAVSYDEIVNFTNGGAGNSCANTSPTGNSISVVNAWSTYTVPKSTPFTLNGLATDADGDPLVYSWEETDPGSATGNWNSGNKPFFRSYDPDTNTWRMFPKLSVVLSGNLTGTKGEYAPGSAQTLNFRFTVRDMQMGGGGVCYKNGQVVVSAAGPFAITYPNTTGITWASGSSQTITWNVNGTDMAPVSCDTIDVYISYDGGQTWSMFLQGTPNDGSELITVPTLGTTNNTVRIRIICSDNIFFDINDNNFTITAPSSVLEYSRNNQIGLQVFPNPFSNILTITASNLDQNQLANLVICDVLGKVIFKKEFKSSILNENLNLSHLDGGMYLISIENSGKKAVIRVIKD